MLKWLREMSAWYEQRVSVPIYLYYLERKDCKPRSFRKRLLFHLAEAYALTGTYSWLYKLRIKAALGRFLVFLLGIDTKR